MSLGLVTEVVPAEHLLRARARTGGRLDRRKSQQPDAREAPADLRGRGQRGSRSRARHSGKCAHSLHSRFQRRARVIPGETQTGVEHGRGMIHASERLDSQHANDRISRHDSTGALRRNRPDGRGLSRQLSDLVRGRPRGTDARDGHRVQAHGNRRRLPHRRGRSALPLSAIRALRRSAARSHAHRRMAQSHREVFLRNIRDADDKLLATGDTTHIICGSNGRPKLLPQNITAFSNPSWRRSPTGATHEHGPESARTFELTGNDLTFEQLYAWRCAAKQSALAPARDRTHESFARSRRALVASGSNGLRHQHRIRQAGFRAHLGGASAQPCR